jgi:excisionase family DNA binding protein
MTRRQQPLPPDLFAALPQPRVTRKHAAEVLHYSERQIDRLIAQGRLKAFTVPGGRRVLIDRASVAALLLGEAIAV